jgi:hypothetical protein
MGTPEGLSEGNEPDSDSVTEETRVTLRDMDGSPTKAWLVGHRADPQWSRYYDLAFAKRPREELYVIADDPHQVKNVVDDDRYASVKNELRAKLMAELERTGDPRIVDGGRYFETPPLAGPVPEDSEDSQRAPRRQQRPRRPAVR